ncbi:MAG: hypothetical protein V3S98_09175, partial [Dehalococcoidia bacterium]
WLFEAIDRRFSHSRELLQGPEEWKSGMHLPGMQRMPHLYTRYCVPVEENLTRVVFIRTRKIKSRLGRFYEWFTFKAYIEWLNHYNFSGQDYDAMGTTMWQHPEYLSATDSYVVAQRRLVLEHARQPIAKGTESPEPAVEAAEPVTAAVDGEAEEPSKKG